VFPPLEAKRDGKELATIAVIADGVDPEIYRDYPRHPSLKCCARNISTVPRETLTQYITFKRGGRGESVLLYSVVLQPDVLHRPLCEDSRQVH
jgi:hypothetical protein